MPFEAMKIGKLFPHSGLAIISRPWILGLVPGGEMGKTPFSVSEVRPDRTGWAPPF
jgi:hypothetical protein